MQQLPRHPRTRHPGTGTATISLPEALIAATMIVLGTAAIFLIVTHPPIGVGVLLGLMIPRLTTQLWNRWQATTHHFTNPTAPETTLN